jgi:hypothetical protein
MLGYDVEIFEANGEKINFNIVPQHIYTTRASLATVWARWAANRQAASAWLTDAGQGKKNKGGSSCSLPPFRIAEGGGGGVLSTPCPSIFLALAGAELPLGTWTTTAPSPPIPSDDIFLSLTFVQTLAAELAFRRGFWVHDQPIMRSAAAALGKLVDWRGTPLAATAHAPQGGAFLVRCGLLYRRGQGEADLLCIHCARAGFSTSCRYPQGEAG